MAVGGYSLVRHDSNETTFELTPNVFHVWGKVDSLNLTLMSGASNIANEYLFQFISGDDGTELELPSNISWNNSVKPVTINPNKVYQVRILMNCANLYEFDIVGDDYFTIESLEDNNEISFTYSLLYSINYGEWKSGNTINLNSRDKARLKAALVPQDHGILGIGCFSSTGKYNVSGNIMSLLFESDFINLNDLPKEYTNAFYELFAETKLVDASNLILPSNILSDSCYHGMFRACTSLTAAPELPAMVLSYRCYCSMFSGCTSLTTAPELPATEIGVGSYRGMFSGCTSLTIAPELPATIINEAGYEGMFSGCTSLIVAPELPAMHASYRCYYSMFYGCTNLTTTPKLPAMTLEYACYNSMFRSCTSLTQAPELPAITLADYCYHHMFCGCTSLTVAPELPATTLADSCYSGMFNDCTGLTAAPELPATTLASCCYYSMFSGTNVLPDCSNIDFTNETVVASGGLEGLFVRTKVTDADLERILPKNSNGKYCLPVTTLADYCYYHMFMDCTSLTAAPILPAMVLAENCYDCMFEGCTGLTTAPELPATTIASCCYQGMFHNCTSLTTAPELPATTLARKCYEGIFCNCTSLTTAPELPAITLAESCYYRMFCGCTSLTVAPELPATILVSECYYQMFEGCCELNYIKMLATDISAYECLIFWVNGVSSTGTFIKSNGVNIPTATNSNYHAGIPSGWTVINDGEENIDPNNGHEYVDLGLPSGLKWAKCNVGAEKETDYGLYFAWGETIGHDAGRGKRFEWGDYKYCNGSSTTLTKYNTDSSYGIVDNLTTLELEDDAASVNMGGNWRMPSKEEYQELIDNTTNTWTTIEGVNGRLFTGNNGNTLFFPASGSHAQGSFYDAGTYGAYWGSSIEFGDPAFAYYLFFGPDGYGCGLMRSTRYFGHGVRGVME